jgi:hypothetical protein
MQFQKRKPKQSFLITFKPDTESPRGWPMAELRRVAQECKARGWAEEDWRFQSVRRVRTGDRIFLLLQGKDGPAVIGYGESAGAPKQELNVRRICIRFEYIVDPTVGVLVSREKLLKIPDAKGIWRTQSSGIFVPSDVASKLESLVERSEFLQDIPEALDEAFEGRQIPRLHLIRERDERLVRRKLEQAIKRHGKLICEVCGFDFAMYYGPLGEHFMECHHKKPLHTLSESAVTRIDDLALVCSNCHRMIHRRQAWITVEELKSIIATQGSRKNQSKLNFQV